MRPAAALRAVSVVLLAAMLAGCGGESVRMRVDAALARLDQAVERLGTELDSGSLRNGALIGQYAAQVKAAKPELDALVGVLAREATRDGTLFRSLVARLGDARAALPPPDAADEAYRATVEEINSLAAATDPGEFNRALADPLNVLADLSGGTLPRVDAISADASKRANSATDLGPGSQLVGNPHYGQWRTDSGGSSFWVWYGQFALMRDLLGGPRIGYGAWAGGRDYSYYHDYGRRNYTSPAARRDQARVESTARRKFASQGRAFNSPYARQRQGASNAVARQKFASAGGRASGSRSGAAQSGRSSRASVRGFGGGRYRGPSRGK